MTKAVRKKKWSAGLNLWRRDLIVNQQLYLMMLLPLVWVLLFCYGPMIGLVMAFKNYQVSKGIWGSDWVGVQHFVNFVTQRSFPSLIRNTLIINFYSLAVGFPIPILLALSLNICASQRLKKTVQMVTYAPYFISTVVMVSILYQFLSPKVGLLGNLASALGGTAPDLMGRAQYFRHVYVWSGVWQGMGWSSILYLAALAGIDPALHEAAIVDGATRLQRIWHIDLPGMLPTVVIQLILAVGNMMNIGFEKIYLMQNTVNLSVSEVIPTYIYKQSILAQFPNFGYATAVGLFNSVISLILLVFVNYIAKRLNDISLW